MCSKLAHCLFVIHLSQTYLSLRAISSARNLQHDRYMGAMMDGWMDIHNNDNSTVDQGIMFL